MKSSLIGAVASMAILTGCASLYHVQVGEIDNRTPLTPFEVMVSETTVSLDDLKSISNATMNERNSAQANDILSFIQMFQMGNTTGTPVYNHQYVDRLYARLLDQCPSGQITGLTMVREAREYPVIKGEIIKIKGFCRQKGST